MLAEDGMESDLGKEGYIAEPKFDDTRCIIERDEKGLRIYGRKGLVYNEILPQIRKSFEKIRAYFRLDGGLVYIDKEGRMIFAGSQKRCQISNPNKVEKYAKAYPLIFYVWDIVMLNGENFEDLPYIKRRMILVHFIELQKALYGLENVRIVPVSAEHKKMYDFYTKKGFEGVVLKRLSGKYTKAKRSFNWLKVKCRDHTPFVLSDNARLEP